MELASLEEHAPEEINSPTYHVRRVWKEYQKN